MQPSAQGEYLCKPLRLGGRADFIAMTDFPSLLSPAPGALPRRTFLRVAGASAATVGLVLAGCGKTSDPTPAATPTLNFGSNKNTDVRLLNYLLFIKQLEFAFYDKVGSALPADLPAAEQAHLRDLREHELIQQQTIGNILSTNAIPQITFDFTSVNLTTRAGVLAAAQTLEDTASSAFLGVLPLLQSNTLFTLAAKMSSVEARHAALIRDLLVPGTFAGDDVVTATGQQAGQAIARTPAQAVAVFAPFLPTVTITIDSLPTA